MKFRVKNRMCYYFHDIIKFEYFDSDNVLIDEKLYDNFLFITFRAKLYMVQNHSVLCSIK